MEAYEGPRRELTFHKYFFYRKYLNMNRYGMNVSEPSGKASLERNVANQIKKMVCNVIFKNIN